MLPKSLGCNCCRCTERRPGVGSAANLQTVGAAVAERHGPVSDNPIILTIYVKNDFKDGINEIHNKKSKDGVILIFSGPRRSLN